MSGVCSAHKHHEPGCKICDAEKERMNLKPCPGCGVKESVAFSKDKPSQAYCINCGVAGPTADTPEEAELFWNLMPRRDDSPNQYAMRIRVKLYTYPRHGKEAERISDGKGWVIDFGMKYSSTAAVVERDNGNLELVLIENIEVDKAPESRYKGV